MSQYSFYLIFPTCEDAGRFYSKLTENPEYGEFNFYYNKRKSIYGTFWDVDYYDEAGEKYDGRLISEAIEEKVRKLFSLFRYSLLEGGEICYASGYDNKYASFVFSPGEGDDLFLDCLEKRNFIGSVNLMKGEMGVWLFVAGKDFLNRESDKKVLKKIKIHKGITFSEIFDFTDAASMMLRGFLPDEGYVKREKKRILFSWNVSKIPKNFSEALEAVGYRGEVKGEHVFYKSDTSLPTLWSDYFKVVDIERFLD